jgi:hypothetical protein
MSSKKKSKSIYAENTWIALVRITSICAIQIDDNCMLRHSYPITCLSVSLERLEIQITSTISDRSRSRRSN